MAGPPARDQGRFGAFLITRKVPGSDGTVCDKDFGQRTNVVLFRLSTSRTDTGTKKKYH